jgi:hypothetical protein
MDAATGDCPSGVNCDVDPNGVPYVVCSEQGLGPAPAPGLNCVSLIGKVGLRGKPFEVGTWLRTTTSTGGELYLGVNDVKFSDNTGSWIAVFSAL